MQSRLNFEKTILKRSSIRYFMMGLIVPIIESIHMIYMVEYLDGSILEKTIMTSLNRVGFFISIFLTYLFTYYKLKLNQVYFSLYILGSMSFLFNIFSSNATVFIIFTSLVGIAYFVPMSYQSNLYTLIPKKKRAQIFSKSIRYLSLSLLLATTCYNLLFDYYGQSPFVFKIIFIIGSISFLFSSFISLGLPPIEISQNNTEKKPPSLKSLYLTLKEDRLFLRVEFAWLLLGTGVWAFLPYRTNFLLEDQFGYSFKPESILLFIVFLPEIVKFISYRFLSKIFDLYPFYVIRILTNVMFLLHLLLFFLGGSIFTLFIGTFFLGVGNCGGELSGGLIAHKLAKRKNIPSYTQIHFFLLGFRNVLSPLFGLYLFQYIGITSSILLGASLVVLSTLIFISTIKGIHQRSKEI